MKKMTTIEEKLVNALLPRKRNKKTKAKHIVEVYRLREEREQARKEEDVLILQDKIINSNLYVNDDVLYCLMLEEIYALEKGRA